MTIPNPKFAILFAVLLITTIAARSTSELYDELVDVLMEIKDSDDRTDGEKRGTITTRDDSDTEKKVMAAFEYAENYLQEYNDLKRLYYVRGGNLEAFETPKQEKGTSAKNYQYTLLSSPGCATGDVKAIVFEVRACNDAHVGLKEDDTESGDLYEIVIGGWGNTQSVIRNEKQGISQVVHKESNLLDCNEYRTFMVGWSGGNIQVAKLTDSGWEFFMKWEDPRNAIDVNFIGLTTARWASGHFRTPKRGDDIIIDTPRTFDTAVYTMLHDRGFPTIQMPPYLIFEVMTCRNAHIGLFETVHQDISNGIEIVIGTALNTESVIRSEDITVASTDLSGVVDCDEYRAFMVSWYDGNIQVFRQTDSEWEELMSCRLEKVRSFDFIGVTTNVYASGKWRLVSAFETGLDAPPGDTSSETMAALNNMDTAQTDIDMEEEAALTSLIATKHLLDKQVFKTLKDLQEDQVVMKLWTEKFDEEYDGDCSATIVCDGSSEYRTINGECNNLNHPHWGAAHVPQNRLLPPDYDDVVNSPRSQSVDGSSALPSARSLSVDVFTDPSVIDPPDDPMRSLMIMVWGQFTDHDVGETPISKGYNDVTVECCNIVDLLFRDRRQQCFTIPIDPSTDPVFTHDCMNFVRSVPARTDPCKPGVREQLNAITSYIDGSMVYGSEHDVALSLRADGGKMKVECGNFMPANSDHACVRDVPDAYCFLAGDIRVNENPLLSTIHTAFVRFHNILAERFDASLGGEEIYQRTRQIIGAIIQRITYDNWLPSVLGPTIMAEYSLGLSLPYSYDDTLDAGMLIEVTTAAYRYGHTLIKNIINHVDEDGNISKTDNLADVFFATHSVFEDAEGIARGMFDSPVSLSDRFFVSAIENQLFGDLDLSALNIQRGRDHGVPGYVEYLEVCFPSSPKPTTFNELYNHNTTLQNILDSAYSGLSVEDIDLIVGGMTEESVPDGHVGPLFACLLGKQFHALKYGDRFWYQNILSDDQQRNVEKVTLSKVFCEAFNLAEVSEDAFLLPGFTSPKKCSDLDDIDVDLWMD